MNELDVYKIRQDFPAIRQRKIVYLDNAASTQKPRQVLERMQRFYEEEYANVHRGLYPLAERATEAYEAARKTLANFVGADTEEIVFMRNATEALNFVALTWGRRGLTSPRRPSQKDIIMVTRIEHHSNYLPWVRLSEQTGAELHIVEVDENGELDWNDYLSVLATGKVKIFACTHASNVLGVVTPIKKLTREAKRHGVIVVVDGAQAAPHVTLDLHDLDVDFYAFTGHKMYGPTGIGVLYGKKKLLDETWPLFQGGEMVKSVKGNEIVWKDVPWRFEPGTPPIVEAIGLAAAADYLQSAEHTNRFENEKELLENLLESLSRIPEVKIMGSLNQVNNRIGIVSFTVDGIHVHDVAEICGYVGVCLRAGYHCAEPLLRHWEIPGVVRASLGIYNDERDIETLVQSLRKVVKTFR